MPFDLFYTMHEHGSVYAVHQAIAAKEFADVAAKLKKTKSKVGGV